MDIDKLISGDVGHEGHTMLLMISPLGIFSCTSASRKDIAVISAYQEERADIPGSSEGNSHAEATNASLFKNRSFAHHE